MTVISYGRIISHENYSLSQTSLAPYMEKKTGSLLLLHVVTYSTCDFNL